MTEDEIERRIEKMTDALDRQFMRGELSQKEYDHAIRELFQWAEAKYARTADRIDGYDRDDLGESPDY